MGRLEELEAEYGIAPPAPKRSRLEELEAEYGLGPAADAPKRAAGSSLEDALARASADAGATPAIRVGPKPGPTLTSLITQPKPVNPVEEIEAPDDMSTTGEAAVVGFGQGASAGFMDEAVALMGTKPNLAPAFMPGLRGPGAAALVKGFEEGRKRAGNPTYEQTREGARKYMADLREKNPKTFAGAEIAGAVASPANRLGPARVAGAKPLANVARAAARGAVQGGVAGAGYSEADLASLDADKTKDFARDVATGAGLGGALGAAAEGGSQVMAKILNTLGGRQALKRRVLNEIAEGDTSTTPRGRQALERAAENVVTEVVDGPQGNEVRRAYLGGASEGREKLRDIMNKLGEERTAAYKAFEDAGKAKVDVQMLSGRLGEMAQAERKAGEKWVADSIDAFKKTILDEAKNTGGMTLTQLRGLTTGAIGLSDSVATSSITNSERAAIATQARAAITRAMDDTLEKAAEGSADLGKAANAIRAQNKRWNALLTVDDALKQRVAKEATGAGAVVQAVKKYGPTLGGGVGAAVGAAQGEDLEGKIKRGAEAGVFGVAVPWLLTKGAQGGQRAVTSLAIGAARGNLTSALPRVPLTNTELGSVLPPLKPEQAARVTDRLGRALGRAGVGRLIEDDEEDQP